MRQRNAKASGLNPTVRTAGIMARRWRCIWRSFSVASIAVDYHVTQVVDGTKGIHGMIPKAIFAGR